jgi:hypothetical protein
VEPNQPNRREPDRITELDPQAGARRTAPGRPPGSVRPGPALHVHAPGAGIRAAEHSAEGTSEESAVVTGIAPTEEGTGGDVAPGPGKASG